MTSEFERALTPEVATPMRVVEIQKVIEDFYYFDKMYSVGLREQFYSSDFQETRELRSMSLRELKDLIKVLDNNSLDLVVASSNDPTDPLIIFRRENGLPVRERELGASETFSGQLLLHQDSLGIPVRISSAESFAYLSCGTLGSEFKIVGLVKR